MNIGQQVIEAVQKPGLITEVNTTIAYLNHSGEEYQQETIKAWLDFPGQRVRVEGWLDGEPSSISVIVDGMEIGYSQDRDQIDEHPVRFFGMSLEEARDTLPQHLSNPALYGLVPLAGALVYTQGKLRPAGSGQWQGNQATVWEANFAGGPEEYDHAYTTIYLEPETFRPLGQELWFSESENPELPGMTMSVTYQLDFLLLRTRRPASLNLAGYFIPTTRPNPVAHCWPPACSAAYRSPLRFTYGERSRLLVAEGNGETPGFF
jgi:hypothetical protein